MFANDFSTTLPYPAALNVLGAVGMAKFATATPYFNHVGLSDWASIDQNGSKPNYPKFPYRLIFHPP